MLDNASCEFIQSVWKDGNRPIDPYKFAKKIGIIVTEIALPDGVFAAVVHKTNKTPRIFIAISDSENTKKFSCAVGIGFFFQNKILQKENYQCIYFRDDRGTMEEQIAYKFAIMLLSD